MLGKVWNEVVHWVLGIHLQVGCWCVGVRWTQVNIQLSVWI